MNISGIISGRNIMSMNFRRGKVTVLFVNRENQSSIYTYKQKSDINECILVIPRHLSSAGHSKKLYVKIYH